MCNSNKSHTNKTELSVEDHEPAIMKNELRQTNGNQKARVVRHESGCKAKAYDPNGRKGSYGNGGSPEAQSLENFPVHVFPRWIRDFIEEHNEVRGFPKDYTSAGVMAALSLACGNNRYIERPYKTKSVIWIALVGRPGAMKTHPLNAALAPFNDVDEKMFQSYKEAKSKHESKPEKSRSTEEPKLKQLTVNDTTMEALTRVLDNNPSGVLLHKDELISWVKEMDRYRQSGGDMENWNSIFNHQPIRVNRVSGNNLFVADPYVSIVGTIQPRILNRMSPDGAMVDNGFIDRILFVYPEKKRDEWIINNAHVTTDQAYCENIRKILDQRSNEHRFEISNESINLLKEWHQGLVSRFNGADELEEGIMGKLQIYVLRFMLMLHIAHNYENPSSMISEEMTEKAILLVRYFENQARKVRTLITGRNPISSLTEEQSLFLSSLSDEFYTSQAQEIGQDKFEMPERTITDLLNRWIQLGIIIKVKRGIYRKV